jgi:hypothetical protein
VLPKADEISRCDWRATDFADLKQRIAKEVPEGDNKRAAMERIEQRLDPNPPKDLDGEDEWAKFWAESAKFWAAREREAPAPEAYEKSLAGQWRELGCAAEGAPYVLHGLIAQLSGFDTPSRNPDRSDAAKARASDFLDEAHCPGARGLSESDKAELKKIAARLHRKRQNRDAKFRRDQIALLPLRW